MCIYIIMRYIIVNHSWPAISINLKDDYPIRQRIFPLLTNWPVPTGGPRNSEPEPLPCSARNVAPSQQGKVPAAPRAGARLPGRCAAKQWEKLRLPTQTESPWRFFSKKVLRIGGQHGLIKPKIPSWFFGSSPFQHLGGQRTILASAPGWWSGLTSWVIYLGFVSKLGTSKSHGPSLVSLPKIAIIMGNKFAQHHNTQQFPLLRQT